VPEATPDDSHARGRGEREGVVPDASARLGARIPIGHTGDSKMMGIGAILGVPVDMKPATCAPYSNLRGKQPSEGVEPSGNFSDDADFFPKHVLVVDDEPLIRWSVCQTLSDLGFDVEEAPDAASALRSVTNAALPFNVVVLDLRLPDMNDLSLLGTLRQVLPSAALILMTAFGTAEIVQEARALGATVLNKPFELDELRRLVIEPGTDAK
jgi:CheY-like chemotaxis protein